MGLDDALRAKGDRFVGILNGLDPTVWDPATDPTSRRRTRADDLSGQGGLPRRPPDAARLRSRRRRRRARDDRAARPAEGLRPPRRRGPRLLAGGRPDRRPGVRRPRASPSRSGRSSRRDPDRVALIERFDRAMARRIYAGADLFLMPSRFEPCGQGQMIALRYGTPPVVRRTGGLADTVVDETDAPADGARASCSTTRRRRALVGGRASARPRCGLATRPAWDGAPAIAGWPSTSAGTRARRPR